MGLDYRMVFFVTEDNRKKVYDYIKLHGELNRSYCSLSFNMDYSLIKYLQGWSEYEMQHNFECVNNGRVDLEYSDSKYMIDFNKGQKMNGGEILPDGKIKIGAFDIYERNIEKDYIISLVAVTTDMSLLLKESYSMHQWLIDCSKYANAKIAYLDYESDGLRILWHNDKFIDISIGENMLEEMKLEDAIGMITTLKQVSS